MLNSKEIPTALDRLAILFSGICLIHCLLMPVIITLLPIMASSIFSHEQFHKLSLFLVLPTSAIALFLGCWKHRYFHIVITGGIGLGFIIFTALWGHELLTETAEKITMSIGGIILAISHALNFRACRTLTCRDQDCSSKHHH